MAWNVNGINSDNEIVRKRLQSLDPDIILLNETMAFVENKPHFGMPDRKIYNINPIPKKGLNGGTRERVELIMKEDIERHVAVYIRVEEEDQGLLEAITIKLKDGTLVTGLYNSPATQTGRLKDTLSELKKKRGRATS